MTTSLKVILIILGGLVMASGWIVALRRPAIAPLPAEAEWHGTPEQGAFLIEKKRRDDAFREKYGIDPALNPTKKDREFIENFQKAERAAQEQQKKDKSSGKYYVVP